MTSLWYNEHSTGQEGIMQTFSLAFSSWLLLFVFWNGQRLPGVVAARVRDIASYRVNIAAKNAF